MLATVAWDLITRVPQKIFHKGHYHPCTQADKISWKSDSPVWIDQWPLPSQNLEAASRLVQEQLGAGHIETSTSPWNTPIFVIQNGTWHLLQDVREINKTMISMGVLQPGLPSPWLFLRIFVRLLFI